MQFRPHGTGEPHRRLVAAASRNPIGDLSAAMGRAHVSDESTVAHARVSVDSVAEMRQSTAGCVK
jgi:hypothetical protein